MRKKDKQLSTFFSCQARVVRIVPFTSRSSQDVHKKAVMRMLCAKCMDVLFLIPCETNQ
jgi:hypothetical protein